MIPMPPSCASAIASDASVTVSIAAETSGILIVILFVRRVFVSAWLGTRSLRAGISRTSSNVIPSAMILFLSIFLFSGVMLVGHY